MNLFTINFVYSNAHGANWHCKTCGLSGPTTNNDNLHFLQDMYKLLKVFIVPQNSYSIRGLKGRDEI